MAILCVNAWIAGSPFERRSSLRLTLSFIGDRSTMSGLDSLRESFVFSEPSLRN